MAIILLLAECQILSQQQNYFKKNFIITGNHMKIFYPSIFFILILYGDREFYEVNTLIF